MRMRTPTDIGLLIRERRRELGLDQRTLAERVGVSRQWIVGAEKGKRRAELGLILRTLAALGITLRSGDEPAPAPGTPVAPESLVNIDDVIAAHTRPRRVKR